MLLLVYILMQQSVFFDDIETGGTVRIPDLHHFKTIWA
jgi:hypothetical protein